MKSIRKHTRRLISKRAAYTTATFAAGIFIGWYAGVDLLERGLYPALTLYSALSAALIVWTFPGWNRAGGDQ
ncbi:hypothetical protein [Janthinobacterium aquaticum]|uniref:hypothetical protein n=1 Tax=Janthinobacterium sp. FT58W TaxID=2654254 RepID=UPI0012652CE2|nr:hypothetical protein [Janthinobacterium sp. FT58W]KAB8042569.1 hypothetical protein GCM43_13685 [Janthinobacterium sp. FT58W]